jgi:hypothetical protein
MVSTLEGSLMPREKVMRSPGSPRKPDFRARVKTNDVPVMRLIGFQAKEIASQLSVFLGLLEGCAAVS